MKIQQSYKDTKNTGKLYLVGTPIGNLDDITIRALIILEEVDLIAAEDTRQTIKLLNHFKIEKRLISYHEHNKEKSGKKILTSLINGVNIALVSDAGMPAISDPGYELVRDAIEQGITVIPIPGVNAAITGLVASGISTRRFLFIGFLPNDNKVLMKDLTELKQYKETLICYEAPHRILKRLETIREVIGDRKISLSRELTKKHEEFIRGSIGEIINYLKDNNIKGEITLVIEGIKEKEIMEEKDNRWGNLTINEHVKSYIEEGKTTKEAIQITAKERNMPKREVYQLFHSSLE